MSSQKTGIWDSRIDDHFDNIESRNDQYAGYRGIYGNDQSSGDNLHVFLNRQVALDTAAIDLDLDELQRLPEYLCELTVRSEDSEICLDHFEFWAWTGAVSSYLRLFGDHPISEDSLGNVCLLIQSSLLTLRNRQFWKAEPYWHNPSYLALLIDNFNLVTLMGYPTIEGLLRRHCDETCPDGTVQSGYESTYDNYVHRSHAYIGDLLELWQEENASSQAVQDSLDNIDDFANSFDSELQQTFQNLGFLDIQNSDSFLDILRQLRNANLHGETSTQAIGSILTTLSCLVIWDSLDSSSYQQVRNTVKSTYLDVGREYSGWTYGFFPDGFYPLGGQSMGEPEKDSVDLYRSGRKFVIKFGENKEPDDAMEILHDLRSEEQVEYLSPSKLILLLSTVDKGEQRAEIEFDEDGELEVIEEAIETALSAPRVILEDSRPLEIWLHDTRDSETKQV